MKYLLITCIAFYLCQMHFVHKHNRIIYRRLRHASRRASNHNIYASACNNCYFYADVIIDDGDDHYGDRQNSSSGSIPFTMHVMTM